MRASMFVGVLVGSVLILPGAAIAQPVGTASPPGAATRLSMNDAVRLALERNHQLRAQRLNVDAARADEITAALKPNPVFTSTNENFPVFTPNQLFSTDNFANNMNFVESLSYLFERGGKRKRRMQVSQDTTAVASQSTLDGERQLEFQTRQAFINILSAKSVRDLARENLDNFSTVVEVNRQRVASGDLAEADFLKIRLQQLQFEQDLSAAEVALVQARAALRQSIGSDVIADDFDVTGDLAYTPYSLNLDELTRDALAARPDMLAARTGVTLAQDTQSLQQSIRARDVVGGIEYDRAGDLNALGFSLSIELPFHDRNQGNIARSVVALRQAGELEAAATNTVVTDVLTAYAGFKASEKVVSLYQSGYLDQARQSLDITTYVYQNGNGTLLDLLDAERTYRSAQLAYRQALAAYMTAVQQVNFAVGKQVMQ